MLKNLLLWVVIAVVLMSIFSNFGPQRNEVQTVHYSTFLKDVDHGDVKQVTIDGRKISGTDKDAKQFITFMPMEDQDLITQLYRNKVQIDAKPPEERSILLALFISWFPMLVLIGLWIYVIRQMQGGGSGRGAMSFGKSRAVLQNKEQVEVTFADVAGIDEAKQEVSEIVEFLRDPKKFQELGGKIPRGVLMVGPPGTGKTLLAKAIAGEANVSFFSISGSDFVEMFVGVGASRVRDMFEQAKRKAPCIIFIDEIDAVGRHRGAGLGGGHDEREQTLNQLLVEMDGFEDGAGVIVIAATNRPDVLDPALLRPGRFDRQVVVALPDIRGREQILKVHLRNIPLAKDVDPAVIARGTPGFSGADLANLVNEAALLSARDNKKIVDMASFDKARDKILMGTERRTLIMSEKERLTTAYHEAGHAIVGRLVPEYDPIYKVTIIPRGRALGVTMYLPESDPVSRSKLYLESQISVMFGGRVAEALINGEEYVTTGASNDIQKATEVARSMVTKWGLSRLGPQMYSNDEEEIFLGHAVTRHKELSEDTAKMIDQEVRDIIDRNYARAKELLTQNLDKLHLMARALVKYETLDADQVNEIMSGKEPSPPSAPDYIKSFTGSSSTQGKSGTTQPDTDVPNLGGVSVHGDSMASDINKPKSSSGKSDGELGSSTSTD